MVIPLDVIRVYFISSLDTWIEIEKNICYGSRDNTPAKFTIDGEMLIMAVKLVHNSGFLTCNNRDSHYTSRWSCAMGKSMTVITDSDLNEIFPDSCRIYIKDIR